MARKSGDGPRELSHILRERFGALGWERKLREHEVFRHWKEVVGPQIAARARPSHVRNRRLTIIVESPAWAQQLSLLKRELLRKITALLGDGVIDDLYFTGGEIDHPDPENRPPPRDQGPPDPAFLETVNEEASRIPDPVLREAYRNARLAANRRRTDPP